MSARSHELERLARLLRVDASALHELEGVSSRTVRRLHDQASDAMLAANRDALEPLAGLAGKLPGRVLGTLIRRTLHPRIAARTVAVLDHDRAVELGAGLPVDQLADIAAAADPRHLGRSWRACRSTRSPRSRPSSPSGATRSRSPACCPSSKTSAATRRTRRSRTPWRRPRRPRCDARYRRSRLTRRLAPAAVIVTLTRARFA